MTFNLCFYHPLWVKWVFIHTENSSGHIGQTHSRFPKCLLNEMNIKLASLIILSIKYNLANTSSRPPPEVKKNSIIYDKVNNFCLLEKKLLFIENLKIISLTCSVHQINITVVLLFRGSFSSINQCFE